MKNFLILSIIILAIGVDVEAYDGRIKDQYGRVVGYVSADKDDNSVKIHDKYGKTTATIESYGDVKDLFDRKRYTID